MSTASAPSRYSNRAWSWILPHPSTRPRRGLPRHKRVHLRGFLGCVNAPVAGDIPSLSRSSDHRSPRRTPRRAAAPPQAAAGPGEDAGHMAERARTSSWRSRADCPPATSAAALQFCNQLLRPITRRRGLEPVSRGEQPPVPTTTVNGRVRQWGSSAFTASRPPPRRWPPAPPAQKMTATPADSGADSPSSMG